MKLGAIAAMAQWSIQAGRGFLADSYCAASGIHPYGCICVFP